ncbi:MAG: coproporphyrinogen oxidase [Clostridiales bacterium]|jgi:oxygen-independent coproporphyrinogen-3 oxidase|nr:coproporphyrinogen oxidase [Clostridiales bacterium]
MNYKPISIYIHIPFCIKKCNYCDFISFPICSGSKYLEKIENYIDVLKKEIASFNGAEYIVKSIFIGGGTPTSIEAHYIEEIDQTIRNTFSNIDNNLEYSMEANPATLNEEKLKVYKQIGINRLSMGLQATDNNLLKGLGRLHTYEEFVQNYKLAREFGFSNINIDLMSGIPDLTLDVWKQTLETIVELNPEHISAYSLIIEENTPLYYQYLRNELILADEDSERQMYYATKEILETAGYNRYEISNYSRVNFECYHNKTYWKLNEYLGFGIAAASLINGKRIKNTENIEKYILGENLVDEVEQQTIEDEIEEYMFLGLRMTEGINKQNFKNRFDKSVEDIYKDVIDYFVQLELLEDTKYILKLTTKGIDVSNQIFEKLILT